MSNFFLVILAGIDMFLFSWAPQIMFSHFKLYDGAIWLAKMTLLE